MFFQRFKGIESAGIHITETVLLNKIIKIKAESFTAIRESCGRGKPCPCPDHDRFRSIQFLFEPHQIIAAGAGRSQDRDP